MKRLLAIMCLCGVYCLPGSVYSQSMDTDIARESRMKAAFIFNFMKFIEWPKGATDSAPMIVCFHEDDFLALAMEQLVTGKTIASSAIVVKKIDKANVAGCSVLYSDNEDYVQKTNFSESVLTISSRKIGSGKSIIIYLYSESNKLRFAINTENLKRARLMASSELLKLAKLIN